MHLLKHLLTTRWALTRRFDRAALEAIEAAVSRSEKMHRGEIRFAIEAALDLPTLWRDRTPRERAIEVFAELGVWNTTEQSGVLIYLLLAERDVEIVADRGLDGRVIEHEWTTACDAMRERFRRGRWREGALAGIEAVGALLAREYPSADGGPDELENRPTLL
jgi:uncharacterized membrane protein